MLVFPHGSYRRFLSARVALFLLPLLVYVSVLERSAAGLTRTNLKLNGILAPFHGSWRIIAREPKENYQTGREKESRTPAQKKIDSQLLYAIYQMRGQARKKGTPTTEIRLRKDEKGRVLVDVRAQVTEKLVSRMTKLGGAVVSRSESYHSILAYLPLGKLEALAKYKEVVFISPASEPVTH